MEFPPKRLTVPIDLAERAPVLTVRARPTEGWPARILVPMKIADYADTALRYALEFADALGAELGILHAAERASPEGSARALEEHLIGLLGEGRYASLKRHFTVGRPEEQVLRAVERHGYDLVALAVHRKPFWERLVLGETEESVLRRCPVPVLSIPSAQEAKRDEAALVNSAGRQLP